MVTEQIANLSAGNRRPGSNPGLSADVKSQCESAGFFYCTQNNFSYLCPRLQRSGRGLVRLRRLVWDQEIAGSNPAAPTSKSETPGLSKTGRFLFLQSPLRTVYVRIAPCRPISSAVALGCRENVRVSFCVQWHAT